MDARSCVILSIGSSAVWDHRFLVTCEAAPHSAQPAEADAGSTPPCFRVIRFSRLDLELLFESRPDVKFLLKKYPKETLYGVPMVCQVR